MKQYLKITTVQPVIMTSSSATQGGLQTLDYITASSLLGLAASKLYATLDHDKAWQMFHNGEVQFTNGYPLVNGVASVPVPASLHFAKDTEWTLKNNQNLVILNEQSLTNHCSERFKRDGETQYKQCRDGFISAAGQVANVKQTAITKTALNEKQTAKDGQLFNYQAIDAGQSFVTSVNGEPALVSQIVEALEGVQRLGRSRSSEFGKVMIEKIDAPYKMADTISNDRIVLLCMSDLEVFNEYGEPTLTPTLTDLVDGAIGTLDVKRSFIRSHSVSLFNRARGGFDSEHQLITKGSVLVFEGVEGLDLGKLEAGIGMNKQLGFGQVWANPNWLAKPKLTLPLFQTSQLQGGTRPKVKIADTPFIRFVKNKAGLDEQAMKNKQVAQSMLQQAVNAYYQARSYNHVINAYDAGPSSSQLRRVAEVYRSNTATPLASLFDGEHAVCKAKNDELGWGMAWDNGEKFITFSEAFKYLLEGKSAKQVELFIELLCRYEPCQYRSLNKLVQEQNLIKAQSVQEAK